MIIKEELDSNLQKSQDNEVNKEYEESTIRHRNIGTSESSTIISQNVNDQEEKNVKHEELEKEEKEKIAVENVFKIWDKESKFSLSNRIHWIWILVVLFVCVVLIYLFIPAPGESPVEPGKVQPRQRPFIEDFANSTTELVEDVIKVDLPSSGSVMGGTVLCRRFATMVEESPAFKETGSTIAKLLIKFSEEIMNAGIALEEMYRKGDMLFWTLNNEISEMISKLNPGLFDRLFEKEDEAFFKNRIRELINMIEEFREKVTAARNAVVDAEQYRGAAEKKVRQGITEAKKFIQHGPNIYEYRLKLNKEIDEQHYLERIGDDEAIDVLNAVEGLEHAENVLNLLERSHVALDLINKILLSYRSKLFDVEAQLGKTEKSKVTKKDLEKLEKLVDILKTSQQKFIGKDTLDDNEGARIYV